MKPVAEAFVILCIATAAHYWLSWPGFFAVLFASIIYEVIYHSKRK